MGKELTLRIFFLPFCHLSYRERIDSEIGRIVSTLSKRMKVFSYDTVCTADGVPRLLKEDFVVILAGSRGVEPLLEEYYRVNRGVCTVVLVANNKLCGLSAVKNFYSVYGHAWPVVIGINPDKIEAFFKLCSRMREENVGVLDSHLLDELIRKFKSLVGEVEKEWEALYLAFKGVSRGLKAVAVNVDKLRLVVHGSLCKTLTVLDKDISVVSYPNLYMAKLKYVVDGFMRSMEGDLAWMYDDKYVYRVCVGDPRELKFDGVTVTSLSGKSLKISRGEILSVNGKFVTLKLDSDPVRGEAIIIPSKKAAFLLEELKNIIEEFVFGRA